MARRRTHRKNHHHSLAGGLHTDRDLLDEFCEMAAESAELEHPKDAEATDEVVQIAEEYDAALAEALDEMCEWGGEYPELFPQVEPDEREHAADVLWDAEAPYLVLMTLRGEGVGIWDDWVEAGYYTDKQIEEVEKFLKKKLGKFASSGGSGKLEQAFYDAAYETAGDEEDEDDED